ncbi:MAG: phage integrase central domain-containing protein, partial [Gammaproteobacteria bacterium]
MRKLGRRLVRGISPAHAKRQEREARGDTGDTFQAIAEEWYAAPSPHRSKSWQISTRRWLTKELYPAIGSKPARDIAPTDILAFMQRLET